MTKCELCGKQGIKWIGKHVSNQHSHEITPRDYYHRFILMSEEVPNCESCGKELVFQLISNPYSRFCSKECRYSNHSNILSELHKNQTYIGTSHFNTYNSLESTREKRSEDARSRALDKNSNGFNSEYSMRVRNRDNLKSRSDVKELRSLYLIKFTDKLKIGSTNDLNRRLGVYPEHEVVKIITSDSHSIIDLEFDTLVKFRNHTLPDESNTFYTEYLPLDILDEILDHLSSY